MSKYVCRTVAVFYAVFWVLWATSKIGVASIGGPITWSAAWLFCLSMSVGVAVGWLAGVEQVEERQQ